jgi:hypothetical protein
VGHSLGAALATLVTFLLRAKFPAVRCFAFAAPACLDQVTAVECEDFVMSIVLGDDIVPSINFYSLCHLRDRVLDALVRSKVNKSTILRSTRKDFSEETFMFKRGEEPESEFRTQIEAFRRKVHDRLAQDPTPQCTLAGKVIHLVHTATEPRKVSGCWKKKKVYTAFESHWSSFLDVPVSKHGVRHHWPDLYAQELFRIRKAWGIGKSK